MVQPAASWAPCAQVPTQPGLDHPAALRRPSGIPGGKLILDRTFRLVTGCFMGPQCLELSVPNVIFKRSALLLLLP